MTTLGLFLTLGALFLWLIFAAGSTTPYTSDAAGNAMSEAFVMLAGIGLWVLLAVLLLLAGFRGGLVSWTIIAAIVLVPASGATALRTAEMFAKDSKLPKWLAIVPIAAPGLILAFAVCAYFPAFRTAVANPVFARITWGSILMLSIVPWPTLTKFNRERERQNAELQAAWQAKENKEQAERDAKDRQYWNETFEKLPANPSLYQLSEFTRHGGEELRNRAFEAIRKLPTRQADAEDYLVNGIGWPLIEIEQINVEATPKFCELARKKLADCAKSISPPVPGRPYSWEKGQVDPYLPAMKWLLDHHCDCLPEITAVESAVRAYPRAADRDRTLATLTAMRQTAHR